MSDQLRAIGRGERMSVNFEQSYRYARAFTDPKKCAEFPQTAAAHINGLLKELERQLLVEKALTKAIEMQAASNQSAAKNA